MFSSNSLPMWNPSAKITTASKPFLYDFTVTRGLERVPYRAFLHECCRYPDYYTQGPRSFFRLHEKGGRYNVVPAHHTAQAYVDAYLEAASIGEDRRGPLFRSCEPGRRDALQDRAMSRLSALKMIKRRARKVGLPAEICAHSFRGTGITEYLRNGGELEIAARIAGHESTRTTQLYNRLNEEISLDEIERIHI